MSNQPLISIAMATYNGEKYLKEQFDSILSQTYSNIEIIICDDYSGDATRSILEEYSQKDKRIKLYFNEKNIGYVKNFEKAICLCSGEFIALSDQDDIWLPEKISFLWENINNCFLIHSDAYLIDSQDILLSNSFTRIAKKYRPKDIFEYYMGNNDVTGCTVLFNKKLLKYVLPFPDNLLFHDWWLAICAYKYGEITYLDKPLVKYRQHNQNQVGAIINDNIISIKMNYDNILKKIENLNGIRNKLILDKNEINFFDDIIMYYNGSINNYFSFNSFRMRLKYFQYFSIGKTYIFKLSGLFFSLFGFRFQRKIYNIFFGKK